MLHVIWSCENLREGWEQYFVEVRRKFPCVVSLCDLVSIIKEEGKSLEEFAMTTWLIWVRRYKQRLNEPAQPLSKLAQSATALLDEFQHGKQRKEPQSRVGPVQWQPPPVGLVKANFDGAVFGEEKEGGIGVVIHSNEGQVLAALSEKVLMPTSMEILEILVARRVAFFARELGFRKVCFEGDADLVVKSLQAGKASNALAGHLVKDFTSIGGYFQSYSIIHVRQQGNYIAHALARDARFSFTVKSLG